MSAGNGKAKSVKFILDGKEVEALEGETIWQVAKRLGTDIPHLCYSPEPGYRADGNCRACMVEIEGERVLAASCIRKPAEGMKVKATSDRAKTARQMVFELLISDQPDRKTAAHDPQSKFWEWADRMHIGTSRFPTHGKPAPDRSHPAMAVNLDACIQCNLCVRACREVQVNDVIGMAGRGHGEKIVFDFDDPMGNSTCVACGECVQACPTGALMPATLVNEKNVRTEFPDREVNSVCPYCGVGCQLTYKIKNDKLLYVTGRDGPANQNRLCVKGRFGFDYVSNPQRLTKPMIRKDGVQESRRRSGRSVKPVDAFPRGHLGRGDGTRRLGPQENPRPRRPARARRLRFGQGLERGGLSVPEAGAHRLRLQQCRPLHAALPRVLGRGAARRRRLCRGDRDVQRVQEFRLHHRDRRQSHRKSSGRRHLLQAGGQARRQAGGDGSARAGAQAARLAHDAIQERRRRRDAQRHAQCHHRRESSTTSNTCRLTWRASNSSPTT